MALEVSVKGAEQFTIVSRRLKRAMRDDLEKELKQAILKATRPMSKAVRDELPDFLPDRYALEQLRPTLRFRTRIKSALGVQIVAAASGKQDQRALPTIERGTLRHPVFGQYQAPWVDQPVLPGFFSKPLLAQADEPRQEIIDAIQRVLAKVANG